MHHVIFYGNTTKTPEGYHEVSPECLSGLQKVVREYGVPEDCILTAKNGIQLDNQLMECFSTDDKFTLVIPGGYTPAVSESLSLKKTDQYVQQLIAEGRLNVLGSCSGLRWLLHLNESLGLTRLSSLEDCPLPDCISVESFRKKSAKKTHLAASKAPIISSSLLPEGENNFQVYWNSGVCAYFGEKEQLKGKLAAEFRSKSIADYRREDLFQVDNLVNTFYSNHQALCTRKYSPSEVVEPKEECYPHAGVIRRTQKGSVVAGIGFHPEIPLNEEDMDPVLGISYEENERRGRQFLFRIFDQLGFPKKAADKVDHIANIALGRKSYCWIL